MRRARPTMKKRTERPNTALVFVYHADGGLFNAVTDMAHKVFSPRTYPCNLCALTYSTFRMRPRWKRFLETLERPLEFLHADEFSSRYGISDARLPAVFRKEGERLELLLGADAINACATLADLERLIEGRLRE